MKKCALITLCFPLTVLAIPIFLSRDSSIGVVCGWGCKDTWSGLQRSSVKLSFPASSVNLSEVPNEEGNLELNSKADACQNGPELLFPDSPISFDPTSSPQGQESSPGVPGFHDSLRKSQGTSAEGVALRKEALQSLKLSLPMQETELCKHLFMIVPLLSIAA